MGIGASPSGCGAQAGNARTVAGQDELPDAIGFLERRGRQEHEVIDATRVQIGDPVGDRVIAAGKLTSLRGFLRRLAHRNARGNAELRATQPWGWPIRPRYFRRRMTRWAGPSRDYCLEHSP